MTERKHHNTWLLVRGCVYLGLAVFFSYAFYIRSWKYRDCIQQAMSSCITPEETILLKAVPCGQCLLCYFFLPHSAYFLNSSLGGMDKKVMDNVLSKEGPLTAAQPGAARAPRRFAAR